MLVRSLLCVSVLCLLLLPAGVNAAGPTQMQVRVYIDTKADIVKLKALDLDVVWEAADYIEIITTAEELSELNKTGLRTEVVQPDLVEFYRSRLSTARDMGGYKTLAEVEAYVSEIIFEHDNIVSQRVVIGQTLQGRPIHAILISDNPYLNEPGEPEVLYSGAIHAREVITPETILRFMDYLTDNYGTDPEVTNLVNNRELWFVPIVNPDGYYHNQVISPGGGGMWRKNRRNNGDGTYGVDLNRNYGYNWGYDDVGSSPDGSSNTYRGTGPFSEPETQVMRDFISNHEFVFTLYFHSYSNLVLWPWGYDYVTTPEENLFSALGDSMAAYNGYEPTPAHGLYTTNGGSDDWGYGEQVLKDKNYAFTIEIGDQDDGFWPALSRVDQLTFENRGAALFLARVADDPYRVLPPGIPTLVVDDTVDAASYTVDWTLTDTTNPAVMWELAELQGFSRLTDPANNFGNFTSTGFTVSSTRATSAPTSFFSGSANNSQRWIQSNNAMKVNAGDSLRMYMWYDIESDWDYAYVEVSTDGLTFTPIAGNITTTANPNGNNRGNGITGTSASFVYAKFGLGAYVGQEIYVRVSYYTDGSLLEDGVYVDDIFPIETYASQVTVSSNLTDTSYTFTDKPNDTYFYRVRAKDAQSQWGPWSVIQKTIVLDADYQCVDADGDGFGDPGHPENDCPTDNCPSVTNAAQTDSDSDDIGDVCDNCPEVANVNQADANQDGIGDACCCVLRGDADGNAQRNVADLTYLVNFLFKGGAGPGCPQHANCNGDSGGAVNVADLTYMVDFLFKGGPSPAACP